MSDEDERRRSEFLDFPWRVWRFLQWRMKAAGDSTTVEPPRDSNDRYLIDWDDVLVPAPDARVARAGDALQFTSAMGSVTIEDAPWAEQLLGLVAGGRTAARTRRSLEIAPAPFWSVINRLAPAIIQCSPEVIAGLEAALPGPEISRLAVSPHGIARAYWRNQIATRKLVTRRLDEALKSTAAFIRFVRELHVTALVGDDFATYYKPDSEISAQFLEPGALHEEDLRVWVKPPETVRLLGVMALGFGETLRSCDERLAPDPGWTGLCFFPARPLAQDSFAALLAALREANAASGDSVLPPLARFHRLFVRLHPFACANQSIVMNLVNFVLRRSHRGYLPHLSLDLCALALSEASYATVLARAVARHLIDAGAGAESYAVLRRTRELGDAFTQQLLACPDEPSALALAQRSPEPAGLLLLV